MLCSKWRPPVATHAKARFRACRAIFLIASSPKLAAKSSTVDFNSATVLGCSLYTCIIAWLQNEKSMGDKSGEFGGQWCSVFLDKILSRISTSRNPDMAGRVILLIQVLLSDSNSSNCRPKHFYKNLQVHFTVDGAFEPHTGRHFSSTMPVHAITLSPVVLRHSARHAGSLGPKHLWYS